MQPAKLYIAADGPRSPVEKELCEQVRGIASSIDWICDIITLFRDENFGYGRAISEAISWFFENEPEGIILEDDCFPSDSFFGFCSSLLEKYRNDERIGHISGSNFQNGIVRGDGSYYFSRQTNFGGWAGWRRVWKDYNLEANAFTLFNKMKRIEQIPNLSYFVDYWNYKFKIYGAADAWGFKYYFLNFINNRLSIIPNCNLITNIGCSSESTHFINDHPFADIPLSELDHVVSPSFTMADADADMYSMNLELKITSSTYVGKDFSFIKDKLMSIVPEKDKYMKIPKIIHQIYFDPSGVPENLLILSQTWEDKHPDWEYRFWNERSIGQFMESNYQELIPLFHSFPLDVQRWDFVRYLILYRFGGLYVDLDYECIEPLDTLLWNTSCCMGLEPSSHAIYKSMPFIIGNALMASVPKHEFINQIIKNISSECGENYEYKARKVLETTGSFMINRVYNAYEKKEDVTLLPAELIGPLSMEDNHKLLAGIKTKEIEEKIEKCFAIHYYFNSWLPQIY